MAQAAYDLLPGCGGGEGGCSRWVQVCVRGGVQIKFRHGSVIVAQHYFHARSAKQSSVLLHQPRDTRRLRFDHLHTQPFICVI